MEQTKNAPYRFLIILAMPVLLGLGMALAVQKLARAQRLLINESTVNSALDGSAAKADQRSLDADTSTEANNVNDTPVTFTLDVTSSNALTGVSSGSGAAWGDYDNDGDLDILLTGRDSGSSWLSSVYENTGIGFTEDLAASSVLTDVWNGIGAWGDYDNDGDLDILLTGKDGPSRLASLYENTGSGFTENITASSVLTGVSGGSAAWGDYDNDGDLDILLTGSTGSGPLSSVFENTGSGFTEDISASSVLTGVNAGSAAWGDYDNDGDLDILLSGVDNDSNPLSSVYKNTGSGFTEDLAASSVLTDVFNSSTAWGDYDNDGDLDILLTGDDGPNWLSSVYENTGLGFVEDITASNVLTDVHSGSTVWGDYDNDGDLDILLTGRDSVSNLLTSLYENTGSGFSEDLAASSVLTGVIDGSAVWGDYDNDGDLDILLTGYDGSSRLASVFRNKAGTTNKPPSPPTGLSSSLIDGQQVNLSWSPPAPLTYTTPYTGLTYNLRVGSSPVFSDVLGPMSCVGACGTSGDGYRQIPAIGGANLGLTATLTLPPGTYYWSVQAVDHTFAGSPWAVEGFFPSQVVNLPVVYR